VKAEAEVATARKSNKSIGEKTKKGGDYFPFFI
jgi:hypothetical protein